MTVENWLVIVIFVILGAVVGGARIPYTIGRTKGYDEGFTDAENIWKPQWEEDLARKSGVPVEQLRGE